MKKTAYTLAALCLAAALSGCIYYVAGPGFKLDPSRAGERLFVHVVWAERDAKKEATKKAAQEQKIAYKEITGRPFPDDMEIARTRAAFNHFGGEMGNAFMVPVPKSWGVETGDILEIIHPGPNEYAKVVRIVNKWNDPTPGGCYWEGSYGPAWAGRLVCKDYAPEAPERRKGYRDFFFSL